MLRIVIESIFSPDICGSWQYRSPERAREGRAGPVAGPSPSRRPPAGESESEKQLRLQREAEAKRISDSIDEELRQEERRFKKRKEDIKVSQLCPRPCRGQKPGFAVYFHIQRFNFPTDRSL